MGVLVSLQNFFEEWTGRGQDDLVSLHLLTILTGQGHISEVLVLPQLTKGRSNVFFEVIPLETKLFGGIHFG